MRLARQVLLHPAHDIAGTHGTSLTGHFAPTHKQCQRGDAADLVARAHSLVRFSIYLGHPNARLQLCSGLYISGRHLAAWSAPRRPEVH